MKMRKILLGSLSAAAFAMGTTIAQAAAVSIDDLAESLSLLVDQPTTQTTPGNPPPGGGSPIDITTPTPSNGISDIVYNPALESLSFTFANQIAWGSDSYFYRYFSEPGGGLSDLLVVRGLAGTTPDLVTFVSDPGQLTGNIATDGPPVLGSATPVDEGTILETGDWQLGFNTGPDQYYVQSDVVEPAPATIAVLGVGLLGVVLARRKRG